jgi:hypothetical protein
MIQHWNLKLRRRPPHQATPERRRTALAGTGGKRPNRRHCILVAHDGVTLPLKAMGNQSLESKVEAAVNGTR